MRWLCSSVMLVAIGLSACGGGSLTTAQLHDQATSICQAAERQINRIATPRTPAQIATFLSQGLGALSPELDQLRALQPSASDAPAYHDALRELSGQLEHVRAALSGLRRHEDPVSTLQTLQARISPLRTRENDQWQKLGIPACLSQ